MAVDGRARRGSQRASRAIATSHSARAGCAAAAYGTSSDAPSLHVTRKHLARVALGNQRLDEIADSANDDVATALSALASGVTPHATAVTSRLDSALTVTATDDATKHRDPADADVGGARSDADDLAHSPASGTRS